MAALFDKSFGFRHDSEAKVQRKTWEDAKL